ncbi:Gfo/Idh/MocA family protein [Rhizosaccharibacter radicis]|uniref:Gfo/Idh/MocA family oxidoreductase n=1 Tax=Rhizosaccharibacter radicis TaxID=2782605 RepID=A0ABT1W0E1_9PROT|nr:Gfo/Idh/MocA family oxidoreductase [Acetobacteraceae bacterium KSS12]
MSLKSVLGLEPDRKVRYAVVALGDIAQEAMLPGIAYTGNSELVALVSGDAAKARDVAEQYGISAIYPYERFGELLASGTIDAIYLATPNWRHAEFAVPALEAGIHVLIEKPLEISSEQGQLIADAQKRSTAKLMVAYRLHFEPATLSLIERIRSGEIGEVLTFSCAFAQMIDPANHRARSGFEAGPVLDMGPYPVNAARYVFEAEPTEVVSAVGVSHRFDGFDDTVAVTLRFPGNRLAQFTISYAANTIDSYTAVGTAGSIQMNPGFMFGMPLEQYSAVGDSKSHKSFKSTDHFGGQMRYFSDCILRNLDPEPDVEEGMADMRVLDGIARALKSGRPEPLPPFQRTRRIDTAQVQTLAARKTPDIVGVSNPAEGKEKAPAN